MTCRICIDEDDLENLIQPCHCTGSTAYVHEKCLMKWLTVSNRTNCEICKFEYETVEVEEKKFSWCPKYRFSDSTDISAAVVLIGIFGHFAIMFFISLWGATTGDMFIYGNIFQGFVIIIFYPKMNPREVLFFWKICSSMSLLLAALLKGGINYVWFELILAAVIGIHMYAHLVLGAKQMVRYINITDRSTNDQVMPGP